MVVSTSGEGRDQAHHPTLVVHVMQGAPPCHTGRRPCDGWQGRGQRQRGGWWNSRDNAARLEMLTSEQVFDTPVQEGLRFVGNWIELDNLSDSINPLLLSELLDKW